MNIKIIYIEESGRPPLYTTMANLPDQEKFFSKIIKEVVPADGKTSKQIVATKPDSPTVVAQPQNTFVITDIMLIKELSKRGKSIKSISKFLELEENFVKKVLDVK